MVKNADQLKKVYKETKKADKDANVILAKFIPATHSAVLAGSKLSIGKGHDSVTGGKKAVTLTVPPVELSPMERNMAGLKKDETPFFEALRGPERNFRRFLVDAMGNSLDNSLRFFRQQLRAGA